MTTQEGRHAEAQDTSISHPLVEFVENDDQTWDLRIDRRTVEFDIEALDMAHALRRRRVDRTAPVHQVDLSGRSTQYTGRR